jgi:hypothetical protein
MISFLPVIPFFSSVDSLIYQLRYVLYYCTVTRLYFMYLISILDCNRYCTCEKGPLVWQYEPLYIYFWFFTLGSDGDRFVIHFLTAKRMSFTYVEICNKLS